MPEVARLEQVLGERPKPRKPSLGKQLQKLSSLEHDVALATLQSPGATNAEIAERVGLKNGAHVSAIQKRIEGKIGPVLERLGVSPDTIIQTIVDCLKADKGNVIKIAKFEKGLKVSEEVRIVPTPDHLIRLKAAEALCRMGGFYPAGKLNVEHSGQVVHEMTDERAKRLLERERALNEIQADFSVEEAASV